MAKKYDKTAMVADHKTGAYTQRELAKKYHISAATVNSVTKGIEQENKQVVRKKVELNQLLKGLSKQELNAIDVAVQFKLSFFQDVQNFGDKALKKAVTLLDNEETGAGFKALVDGVDKLTVTQGLNPRFANAANIEINNSNKTAVALIPDDPIEAARVYQSIIGGKR